MGISLVYRFVVEFAASMRHTQSSHKTTNAELGVRILSTINFTHLRLLAIYATVVEAGSFAAAARKLRSSRSRISEQVAQLEADLGVRLFQRSTRQLNITPEGREIYEQARQLPGILQGVEAITTPSEPSGRVVITLNHDIAHKFLLPVLPLLQQRYPAIQLDLVLDDARLDLIGEQIDLAIRIGIPKDEALIARVMHEERFALFASPEFLARYGTPKSLKELEKLPWVILSQTAQTEIKHLRQNNRSILIKPTQFSRCNSPLMVQKLVMNGLGIGALLPGTVSQEVADGKLVQVMPSITSEAMVFSLVYPSRRQLPARTRAVIEFLLKAAVFNRIGGR